MAVAHMNLPGRRDASAVITVEADCCPVTASATPQTGITGER
jgi:hypothetical protein